MDPIHLSLSQMATVDLDNSFFIQLVLVLGLMVALKALIFRPFLDSIEAREKKTSETQRNAAELKARSEELETRYKHDITAARERAVIARHTLRAESNSHREEVVGAARVSASAMMKDAQKDIDAQFGTARTELLGQVDELSVSIAEKVLGRSI